MRVFHLDFNHVSIRREFVERLLPELARLGYDTILWELENQVKLESCPQCAHPESWSKAEFGALLAQARALGLEPIPLLQTVGHGEYVMKHPDYHHLREHPDFSDCYCTSNPAARAFLKSIVAEYLELFGHLRYFHLGGDEAYRLGTCEVCRQRDRMELFAEHVMEVAEPLLKRGVRPGIWADMILADARHLSAIPRDFLIWDWNYSDGLDAPAKAHFWGRGTFSPHRIPPELLRTFPSALDADGKVVPFYTAHELKKRGYDVVLCSSARSANDSYIVPNMGLHAENIASAELTCRRAGLSGHCVTSWSIRLHPIAAGMPLVALPQIVADTPQEPRTTWWRKVSRKFFGFAEGLEAAALIGRADGRLRRYSGVQWTGLKDGLVAPPRYLADSIAKWQRDNPQWAARAEVFGEMREALAQGARLMKSHATGNPLAALWVDMGVMAAEHLELLEKILDGASTPDLRERLLDLRERLTVLYAAEQTQLSARHNAGLVIDVLLDYWGRRQ